MDGKRELAGKKSCGSGKVRGRQLNRWTLKRLKTITIGNQVSQRKIKERCIGDLSSLSAFFSSNSYVFFLCRFSFPFPCHAIRSWTIVTLKILFYLVTYPPLSPFQPFAPSNPLSLSCLHSPCIAFFHSHYLVHTRPILCSHEVFHPFIFRNFSSHSHPHNNRFKQQKLWNEVCILAYMNSPACSFQGVTLALSVLLSEFIYVFFIFFYHLRIISHENSHFLTFSCVQLNSSVFTRWKQIKQSFRL